MNINRDLSFIYLHIKSFSEEFRNKKIFITGGTGFFGKWLVKSMLYLDTKENLNLKIWLLTRNKTKTSIDLDFCDDCRITLYEGDIINFQFPSEKFDYIIHGASTSSVEKFNGEKAINRFLLLLDGTRRILDFAVSNKISKFLLISSGSVYGRQPKNIDFINENLNISPETTDINSCYGEGKRAAELLCTMYAKEYGFELKIARCFSFVGPFMECNIHFAIGNFIKQVLEKQDIIIRGNGLQSRTYMYMSDLVIWLIVILLQGKNCMPYNVGSDQAIAIKELAQKIKKIANSKSLIKILGEYKEIDTTDRYVPEIQFAKTDLNLKVYTNIDDAILKTINFYKISN